MKKIIIISLLLGTVLFAKIKVGENFPTLTLVDQFDTKIEVKKEGTTKLILSFEKDISSAIKDFLDTKEKNYLANNNIIYISDISSIPSFLVSLFALPKMKKFDFRIALIYDKKESETLVREKEKITLVSIEDNNITSIEFVNPTELATKLK